MIGQSLGHYRVTAKLGEGGMGVVYRATDTLLGRDVALKVLPAAVSSDPERMGRLEREARTLASLNHPNIAAIYGIESGALVMELVEGPELAGPLPVATVAAYARQIADGLAAAHEKGIVHRDLKPANIKVTADGVIKLLDFGIAKAGEAPTAEATVTMEAVMGTAAYMSPEQARGGAVDHRTDIWALGAVLFELATGRRLFARETVSDTLAAVLTAEPGIEAAPEALRPLLRRCLVRDVKKRLGWAGETHALLEPAATPAAPLPAFRRRVLLAAGLLAVGAAGYVGGRGAVTPAPPLLQFSLTPKELAAPGLYRNAAVSPDGKRIVYAAGGRLWVHELETGRGRELEGTEEAAGPFWSPDGGTIGYWARLQIWKVDAEGKAPVALGRLVDYCGGSFARDGQSMVISGCTMGLLSVPVGGGALRLFWKYGWEEHRGSLVNPVVLPTGDVLATTRGSIVLIDPRKTEPGVLLSGAGADYSPTGHIVFRHQAQVQAAPFSLRDRTVTGPAVELAAGGLMPSVSSSGTLLFASSGSTTKRLVIRNRAGVEIGMAGTEQVAMSNVASSPDGRRIAVDSPEQGQRDVWIHETSRPVKTRLTAESLIGYGPVWSPDGKTILYSRQQGELATIASDGTGSPLPLGVQIRADHPDDWSGDGRFVLHSNLAGANQFSETSLSTRVGGAWETRPFLSGAFDHYSLKVSRDGRFASYVSNETGANEVYVRRFPTGSGKWRVSTAGGAQPRWSRDGKELFYLQGSALMAVPYRTSNDGFEAGAPKKLFATDAAATVWFNWKYDELPEDRFVVIEGPPPGTYAPPVLHVIQGWTGLLPGKR